MGFGIGEGFGRKKDGPKETQRIIVAGRPDLDKCDNMITTSRYTAWSFFPVAIKEQFRRVANMYFLVIGCIMAVGWYSSAFDSAISPWTTLGPLAIVISVSLLQEGSADYARHKSDENTNNFPCVVLRRADQLDEEEGTREETVRNGKDVTVSLKKAYFLSTSKPASDAPVPSTPIGTSGHGSESAKIAYERVLRMNIRAGHIVLLRNRDMVPADVILLASSNDKGSAYIETSSIDGETNLKLRNSPHLPEEVQQIVHKEKGFEELEEGEERHEFESLEQATKRIARMSMLAFPHGKSVLDNPANSPNYEPTGEEVIAPQPLIRKFSKRMSSASKGIGAGLKNAMHDLRTIKEDEEQVIEGETKYVCALTSEPPNASVNTYSGKLTMPPVELDGAGIDVPLNAENILLRGAVLRNTEWAIGLACFTGTDTKLVQNSFDTPSKFSQLDRLMNGTVYVIICVMILCIIYLASFSVWETEERFDELWYLALNKNTTEKWPYLPADFEPPEWETSGSTWLQKFFLFVTLLTNFVPLSLYVTIEIITLALKLFINYDLDMYHEGTDTRALARSNTVTDLGQVQYVFSDKTGTLTQNVMRFKRCSVDGLAFGAPVEKSAPGTADEDVDVSTSSWHPLRHLLVGQLDFSSDAATTHWNARQPSDGLEQLGAEGNVDNEKVTAAKTMTFNAEMFCRVMSLCHTVVIEKDLDQKEGRVGDASVVSDSASTGGFGSLFRRRKNTGTSVVSREPELESINELEEGIDKPARSRLNTAASAVSGPTVTAMGSDGAPFGFAYQAESPDEGALVEAASITFGFQVIGRDSSGIRLACSAPTLFHDDRIKNGLKQGKLTAQEVAAETAVQPPPKLSEDVVTPSEGDPRIETWSVLAVNKFDSDRKRMSILVRSPPELGSIPMLLCKGADSSMLDKDICVGYENVMEGDEGEDDIAVKTLELEGDAPGGGGENLGSTAILGMQAHLGDFASEGLRTLVLGVRILTEDECNDWLEAYTIAAKAIKDRDEKLTEAAKQIEQNITIVGATAIEDKLQRGVPDTIAKLELAGIKLWVLTGDKRETAVEIGYSTHVLTPKMHVTEVADGPTEHVRALMAMEFIRLVKMGKLTEYQRSVLDTGVGSKWEDFVFQLGKRRRRFFRAIRRFYHKYVKVAFCFCFMTEFGEKDPSVQQIYTEIIEEKHVLKARVRKTNVRNRAEKIIQAYNRSHAAQPSPRRTSGVPDDELSLVSDEPPKVFTRAQSAQAVIDKRRSQGSLTSTELRSLSLAELTAQQAGDGPVVEEDLLSLQSFFPGDHAGVGSFDRKKRTLLERMFAVDHAVRHGKLVKHLKKEKLEAISESEALPKTSEELDEGEALEKPRALVIEGAALHHLLGDAELEELLFAVASCSESVIACRVSPKQKALLVQLVRQNVSPEPVTLAIGDGANDVGMIQEAHVGIGISGKEGQQAVNASDFAIAQFRYLEELLLVHGRWNFFRQATVVLFSFYKNAIMAGCLIVFQGETLFSGTPLFDEWLIAMLNFVAGIPILFLGFFDRCLDKDYVLRNPNVYSPGRNNELLTKRILIRWIILTFVHIFTLYYLTVYPLSFGGGVTSAYSGLMRNDRNAPVGDGEGGDLKSVGTVSFTCLIIMLGYKVLFETRSLIHGKFPAATCRKDKGEGFFNRVAYTWVGVAFLSIGFYFFALYIYMLIGRGGAGDFSNFTDVTLHVFHTRSISWMVIMMAPLAAMVFDVTGKVYGNMFFPTQTQIHVEIAAKQRRGVKKSQPAGSFPEPPKDSNLAESQV